MDEVGEFVRVSWSPRGDRSWCPGGTLPGPASADGKVVTGWTTFFRLQGVLTRRRGKAEPSVGLDDAPSALPREAPAARPATRHPADAARDDA